MRCILIFSILCTSFCFSSCQQPKTPPKETKPNVIEAWEKIPFQSDFDLERVNPRIDFIRAQASFTLQPQDSLFFLGYDSLDFRLQPFSIDERIQLKANLTYPENCRKDKKDPFFYADLSFPNPCKYGVKPLQAKVFVRNRGTKDKTIKLRLFYQNASYAYRMEDAESLALENHYGMSEVVEIQIKAQSTLETQIPYRLSSDPKDEITNPYQNYKVPVRAGQYEFLLLSTTENHSLFDFQLDLKKTNPFYTYKQILKSKNSSLSAAYVGPKHFKLVLLDEKFKGENSKAINHIYLAKDNTEKKPEKGSLFKDLISDSWTDQDFFKGFISKAPYVEAAYGNRKENVHIDSNGIQLIAPSSSEMKKQKTWGEFLFGPSFTYGRVSVCAQLPRLRNSNKTPKGLIHNIWLYQRDGQEELPEQNHPYAHLKNSLGVRPFEIDLEFWSTIGVNPDTWNDIFWINFSIVDYMKNPNVKLKPGEKGRFENYDLDRLNPVHLSIPYKLGSSFLDEAHVYTLDWTPQGVSFYIDGKYVSQITPAYAYIPNKPMYLWVGSPMYQDGTFYDIHQIPFLKEDQISHIKWIKIE